MDKRLNDNSPSFVSFPIPAIVIFCEQDEPDVKTVIFLY